MDQTAWRLVHRRVRGHAVRKLHHRGRYPTVAAWLRRVAAADPRAVCWRDGLRLDQHPHHQGKAKPRWTAGHTIDGSTTWRVWTKVTEVPPPGDWLAPEVSGCNFGAGAVLGNTGRTPTSNPHARRVR